MKKILVVCLIVSSVLLACMSLNYYANERMIKNYNRGNYKVNNFDVLGFFQPYIAPYNRGNIDYKLGDYDKAIEEYRLALDRLPPKDRECKIRINLALAMVATLDLEEVTQENVDEVIEVLNQAIDVLVEKNCANRDGQSGHDADAQQLEIELQRIIDTLQNPPDESKEQEDKEENKDNKENKENQTNQDKKNDQGNQENNNGNEGGTTEEKSELQQKFEEQQKEVQQERNQMHENNEIFKSNFEYSTDPVW